MKTGDFAYANDVPCSCACEVESVKEASEFLSEYAVLLFGSGATCIRLEKNMHRIARAFGMEVAFSVLPQHIHITLSRGSEVITSVVTIRALPISFAKIASLSKLSWQLADRRVSFECAREVLVKIARERTIHKWEMILLVGLANAAFCRLFGGDAVAMAVVMAAALIGVSLKSMLMRRKVDFRIVVAICAFASSIVAALDGFFSLGSTPGVALGTSVLYLVPGIPLINSFCDIIGRHYLCAIGRAVNAALICLCLTAGLGLAMLLMNRPMF